MRRRPNMYAKTFGCWFLIWHFRQLLILRCFMMWDTFMHLTELKYTHARFDKSQTVFIHLLEKYLPYSNFKRQIFHFLADPTVIWCEYNFHEHFSATDQNQCIQKITLPPFSLITVVLVNFFFMNNISFNAKWMIVKATNHKCWI